MKTATIPSLRVDPALRRAAEDVLYDGESLSALIEASLRAEIEARQLRDAFIARGLASRDAARSGAGYHDAADVLDELKDDLAQARKRHEQ